MIAAPVAALAELIATSCIACVTPQGRKIVIAPSSAGASAPPERAVRVIRRVSARGGWMIA